MNQELWSSSSTMSRKTLTDSLEQPSTLSSIAPREGGGQVYPPSSNKRSLMPMENTLPSLLATAIFLKLMSSRAAEASLSLELLWVKWANNQAGKYIGGLEEQGRWIHLMLQPPNIFLPVCSQQSRNIQPTNSYEARLRRALHVWTESHLQEAGKYKTSFLNVCRMLHEPSRPVEPQRRCTIEAAVLKGWVGAGQNPAFFPIFKPRWFDQVPPPTPPGF